MIVKKGQILAGTEFSQQQKKLIFICYIISSHMEKRPLEYGSKPRKLTEICASCTANTYLLRSGLKQASHFMCPSANESGYN